MDIDGQVIENEAQEPSYYARIPNMAIDDLDVYQLSLYCNYKRTAAEEGTCYKSNATLSKETGMSVSKVKTTRAFLQKRGYIKVKHHIITDESGKKVENAPPTITIINVWEKNHKRYSVTSHQITPPQSPDNPKEDHSKKNSRKEAGAPPKDISANHPVQWLDSEDSVRRAELILASPSHAQRFELQNMASHPMTEAYAKAIQQPFVPNNADKLAALRLQVAGYTPEDVIALVTEKIKTRPDYSFNFVTSDLPGFKNKTNGKKASRDVTPAHSELIYDEPSDTTMVWNKTKQRWDYYPGRIERIPDEA